MVTERRVFLLITVAAAIAFTVLFVQINQQAKHLEQHVDELQETARVLCDRGFIIDDLTVAGILLIEQRLTQDLATGNLEAIRADRRFLNRFATNHLKLRVELTKKGSPCASTRS